MKREKQRLQELRSMSYKDYLQSPEWQETEKAAIRRAGKQCQGCKATNVVLKAYHTSLDNLGCESENDIVALCEACHDRLSQQLASTKENTEIDEEIYLNFPFTKKLSIGIGSSIATIGIPALLHAPLPAELAGLAAAIALAANSPKLYSEIRDYLPIPLVTLIDGMAERSKERQQKEEWNTWDRLLGRHQQEPDDTKEESETSQSGDTTNVLNQPDELQRGTGTWVPRQFILDDTLEIVREFNVRGAVYFGDSEDGGVAIALNEMYHVMDVSSSGKGKSNRFRLAMMQMVSTCETYCINPLAANVKPVTDSREIEVWKPIYDRLANKHPLKEGNEIKDLLTTLVSEMTRRNELEEEGDFSWQAKPIFAFIDELPEVAARCPEAPKLLDKIGRMGRQYCIFLWIASQTANVNDIGLSTAAQAQFKTRIYGGGDKTSSERMMKGAIPKDTERTLQSNGAGLILMLADNFGGCTFTRSPLVTNEALFEYLRLPPYRKEEWMRKKATTGTTSQASGVTPSFSTTPTTAEQRPQLHLINSAEVAQIAARRGKEVDEADEVENEGEESTLSEREKEIGEMFFQQRKTPGQIAKILCGGKAGDAYQRAAAEVSDAIRKYAEVQPRRA